MKFSIVLLLVSLALLTSTGCKKDKADPRPTRNTPPLAEAGPDFFAWSPLNKGELRGSYLDGEQNVTRVSWAKISGPKSYVIENKDSLFTKVNSLETGEYQFELTVRDEMNLFGKDTMLVSVGEMPEKPGEFILRGQIWIPDWYNYIGISDFASNSPGGTFKIFIQRGFDPGWHELIPAKENVQGNALYDYNVIFSQSGKYEFNDLRVYYYGIDVTDNPSIKIVY